MRKPLKITSQSPIEIANYSLMFVFVFFPCLETKVWSDLTYLEKNLRKILRSKNFRQKLRHQAVETEAEEAIKKLPLPQS